MNNKSIILNLTILSLLFSCTSPNLNMADNKVTSQTNEITYTNHTNQPITGKVEFPDTSKFKTKATVTDIGVNATVSLIYPSDHPTNANKTVASGVTNASGVFTINTGFTPNTGDVFVLEASRRIGASGNGLMSVRTNMKWNGTGWNSITTGGVSINSKTTALVAMAGLLSPSVSSDDTINTITSGNPTDIKHNGIGATIINAASITSTADLVNYALTNNQDPFSYLTYSNGQFTLKDPTQIVNSITTFAGVGSPFVGDNLQATDANTGGPRGVAFDSTGNVYIVDIGNHRIRKVDKTTGIITTVAGTGSTTYVSAQDGGPATSANLNSPGGVAFDSTGNMYIADSGNNRIRKVDKTTGIITTVAGTGLTTYVLAHDGGQATSANLNNPSGVAFDLIGNMYIADTSNHRIRKVDKTTGIITTAAGTGSTTYVLAHDGGQATSANISSPYSVSFDSAGNMYIPEFTNCRIRKVTTGGVISTFAGNGAFSYGGDNGQATAASINFPTGVAFDGSGNAYISDSNNARIRKVTTGGVISTVVGNGSFGYAGDGGQATDANISNPYGLAVDSTGNIYIADSNNQRVRKVTTGGVINTFAGGGAGDNNPATVANTSSPRSIAFDSSGNVYIADFSNNRIRKVDKTTGIITTVVGTGAANYSGDNGQATAATINSPAGVAFDSTGNMYIADTSNNRIRKVDKTTGIITTVAGTGLTTYVLAHDGGQATAANINAPRTIVFDSTGNMYISDTSNNRIRKVDKTTGIITTVAGTGTQSYVPAHDGGLATAANISFPTALNFDSTGNMYITDSNNNRIRKVDKTTGIITTVVGTGAIGFSGDGGQATAANIYIPTGVAFDSVGNMYIADTSNNRVRKITPAGIITTVVGTGTANYVSTQDGGRANAANLNSPNSLSIDSEDNMYISDTSNNRIRKVSLVKTISP